MRAAVYTVRSQGVALATDVNAITHDTRPPNELAVDSVALSNCSLSSTLVQCQCVCFLQYLSSFLPSGPSLSSAIITHVALGHVPPQVFTFIYFLDFHTALELFTYHSSLIIYNITKIIEVRSALTESFDGVCECLGKGKPQKEKRWTMER